MVLTQEPTRVLDQRELKQAISKMSRALRDSQGGGIMERFEAVSKLLFTKIVDEREAVGTWDHFAKMRREMQWYPQDTDRTVYERTRSIWQRAINAYPDVFEGARRDFPGDVAAVAKIVQILEVYDLDDTPSDVRGRTYEELLRDTFEKNENQQYFTPRHLVDFIIELCDPHDGERVCDPASGSGGFLIAALDHVRRRGESVAALASGMRGAEVDERMAWVARINVLMHGGDPRSIYHLSGAGSLAKLDQIDAALPAGSFDLIVTNPPFGSDLNDRDALDAFVTGKGKANRRRGILFVERCLELLRVGGRVAIVLDDSVLNTQANEDIRRLLLERASLEAVVSLPDVAFMPYSTAKSSVLLARRSEGGHLPSSVVFMADVENVGNRPNGDPLYSDEYCDDGSRQLRSDLPRVAEEFLARSGGDALFEERFSGTAVFSSTLSNRAVENEEMRLDAFFFHPARRDAEDMLARAVVATPALGELVDVVSASVCPAVEFAETSIRWLGLGDIEPITGRFEVKHLPGDRIKSNAHCFQGGDILFSRLRPKLRKALFVPAEDEGGLCSSELLVFRTKSPLILAEYLAYLLRSDLMYGQLIFQVTGVGRPRVSTTAVRRARIPLPDIAGQQAILNDLRRAEAEARGLRAAAQHQIERAAETLDDAYARTFKVLLPPTNLDAD